MERLRTHLRALTSAAPLKLDPSLDSHKWVTDLRALTSAAPLKRFLPSM